MEYSYDKDKIKENLTLEDIESLLIEFNAEPIKKGNTLISRTVCHGGDSHKLYYYENTNLFHCFTGCSEATFDIFELTRKVMSREHPKQRENSEWNLPEAIEYIAQKFGYSPNIITETNELHIKDDLLLFKNYDRISNIDTNTQEVQLKIYDDSFLKNLPHPIITPWVQEGITKEVMDAAGICYDPKNQGIVIPHYDIHNRLIGIRERTLVEEQAELYGKYMPAQIGGKMFNHPLSFNLYNLNYSKENIQKFKKAIVFESEKSCLKYKSFFGAENDISCAVCGSNLIKYQFWLIRSSGAEEIVIGFDRQYKNIGDEEYYKWVKKLKEIAKKYSNYCNITFLFDTKNLLDYKDAPIDKGSGTFLQLFKERLDKDGKAYI